MTQTPSPLEDELLGLVEDDDSPRSRRPSTALAALAATVLAAGAFLLLGDDSGEEDSAVAAGRAPSATSEASPSPAEPEAPVPPALPASSVQVGGRNPFTPLYAPAASEADAATPPATAPTDRSAVAPALPDAGSAGAGVGDSGAPPVGPDVPGDTTLPTDRSAPTTGLPPAGGSAGALEPSTVLLTRVTGTGTARSAVLSLDGAPTTVAVGSSFGPGGGLQLVSVQQGPEDGQWTAVLRSGDSDPFDVVSGVPTRLP